MSGGFDPHLSEIVRRRFNIEGMAGPDEFSPSIVGIVPLDCDAMSPEYSYYAKEFRAICWGQQGGVAGEYTYFHVQNPAGSNHLTIIKSIWGSVDAGVTLPVGIYRDDVGPGVSGPGHCATDARWGPAPRPGASQISMGTADLAGITGTFHFTPRVTTGLAGEAFSHWAWDGDYILSPGTGLTVWTIAINVQLDCNVTLRERMRTRWEE